MEDLNTSSQRFSNVTPNDHGGYIYITAILGFTYANLTFLTRCFIKWKMFGFDDWALCLAQVAFEIQFALILVSLSNGLGRNFKLLTDDLYSQMSSLLYGNQIVLSAALGLSKVATLLLVRRVFTRDAKKFRITCNIILGLMISWTILAALLVSAGCSAPSTAPRSGAQTCPGLFTRYQVVVITDVITEVVLILMPAYLVCQLHMPPKLKLQVIIVFAFRLPLIPLAVVSLTNFHKSLHSSNPGVDRTPAIVLQQSQLCTSLVAATLPCLKSFIRSFDTGSGMNLVDYTEAGSSGSRGSRGQSYQMRTLGNGSASDSQNRDKGEIKVSRRPFAKEHGHPNSNIASTSAVMTKAYTSGRPREEDAASHGSQELFIRRDVQFEVRSESLIPGGKAEESLRGAE